jgi:endonuclease/exonuclease/phosphatase (EEP) superfamily protein YafD
MIRLFALFGVVLGIASVLVMLIAAPLLGLTRPFARGQQDVPADLHLITFNFDGSNREHERVSQWVRQNAPDVLLIQETYPIAGQAVPGTRQILPYQYQQSTYRGYRGVSILSRYPISDLEGYDRDSAYSRAVVALPSGAAAIYNISLTNPLEGQDVSRLSNPLRLLLNYDSTARDAQIRVLLERLERETLPHIVAGDFNLMEIEAPYRWLSARLTDAFAAAGSGVGATWDAKTPNRLLLRIDYVWYSEGWCALSAELGPELGSDHLPVIARLRKGDSC